MDITSGLSMIALLISFLNYSHTRQLMIVDSVTSKRIEWIHEVRIVISEFINACSCGDRDTALEKKTYLELFLNPSNCEHEALLKSIDECINSDNIESSSKVVIKNAQIMLNKSWQRLKRESGVTRFFEKRRDNQIE